MKILYYFSEDTSYMSQWQRIHIFDELSHYDYDIEVYNPSDYKSIEEANDNLITHIKTSKNKYDLFMTCVGSELLYKESVLEVKKIGIPTLLVCFDNLHAPFMHKKIASVFDIVWLTSGETKWMFERWGCTNIIVQPYAANPFNFKPKWDETIYSVSFIGSPYGSRVNKLNNLTESGIKCAIYTDNYSSSADNSFKVSEYNNLFEDTINCLKFSIGRKVLMGALMNKVIQKQNILSHNENLVIKPTVSFEEMNSLYSNHALSLNISELRNTYVLKNPVHKLHLRTFEIPMSGGLQIAHYTDELASYFEDGKEIVLYKSKDELISKANFYLNEKNDKVCLKMKQDAYKRAQSDHSWYNRFKKII